MAPTCAVDGCCKPAARAGLCWTHTKRRQRKKDTTSPVRGYAMPLETRVKRAATRYAEAEDDDEYDKARKLLDKYTQGKAGRLKVKAIVTEVVEAVLEKLLRGQIRRTENVHSDSDTPMKG
jgi:tryptophanyl-tRNA synthetase